MGGENGGMTNSAAEERVALWEKLLAEQGHDSGLGRDCGFECPITSELMHDPVIADDGHSYERTAIESWFGTGNRTSPVTGKALPTQRLHPNHALRIAIDQRLSELRRCSVTEGEGESRSQLNRALSGGHAKGDGEAGEGEKFDEPEADKENVFESGNSQEGVATR